MASERAWALLRDILRIVDEDKIGAAGSLERAADAIDAVVGDVDAAIMQAHGDGQETAMTDERENTFAYLRDAAHRWNESSGIFSAVNELAAEILHGAALEAFKAGELDDILAELHASRPNGDGSVDPDLDDPTEDDDQ